MASTKAIPFAITPHLRLPRILRTSLECNYMITLALRLHHQIRQP